MNVIGYDPYLSPALAEKIDSRVKTVSDLDALYAASDYITLHVPSTPQTKGCINKDSIAKMKNGAVIINNIAQKAKGNANYGYDALNNAYVDMVKAGIVDPTEKRWPSLLPVMVEDAETGRQIRFGGGKRALKKLDEAFDAARRARREVCRRARVDLVEIGNNRDVLLPMVEFFSRRRRQAGRG